MARQRLYTRHKLYQQSLEQPFSDLAVIGANASLRVLILDVGWGCGSTSLSYARVGALVTGIDISKNVIAEARKIGNITFIS